MIYSKYILQLVKHFNKLNLFAKENYFPLDFNNEQRYHNDMIKNFSDKYTEDLFNRNKVRKFPPTILKVAYRKLLLIDATGRIEDLRVPPGNRLEKLSGNLSGKHSIRINNQWRIVFNWKENNAYDVEIIDYHKG